MSDAEEISPEANSSKSPWSLSSLTWAWQVIGLAAATLAVGLGGVLGITFTRSYVTRTDRDLWAESRGLRAEEPFAAAPSSSWPSRRAQAATLAVNSAIDAYLHRPEVVRRGSVKEGELVSRVVAPLVDAGLAPKEIGMEAVKRLMDGGKEIVVDAAHQVLAKLLENPVGTEGPSNTAGPSIICAPVLKIATAPLSPAVNRIPQRPTPPKKKCLASGSDDAVAKAGSLVDGKRDAERGAHTLQ